MAEQEPIRDPRVEPEGPRVVIAGGEGEAVGETPEGVLGAIQDLQVELAKTGVISDVFKDYIMRMALMAAEEAISAMAPEGVEQEALRQEFLARRFEDKSRVKLNAPNIEELMKDCLQKPFAGRLVGEFFDMHFPPPHDAMKKLLLGTYDEVVSVREWLWREIDEQPSNFCDVEKRLSEEC
jgi:hypothetical protein